MTAADFHEHEAEHLVESGVKGDHHTHDERVRLLAAAQVHATLALLAPLRDVGNQLDAMQRGPR